MGLCQICSQIPFENLPHLPDVYHNSLPGLPDEGDLYYVEYRESAPSPLYAFGYYHYQSKSALKQSANDCNLCSLINDEFRRIIKKTSLQFADRGFYITKREGDQQGFVVWTYGVNGDLWRVGAYGFYIKRRDKDPLASVFKGHQVHRDAGGATARGVVEHWVSDCVKNHKGLCGPPKGSNAPLPTRVIDVTTSPPTLVDTNGSMTGYYTILSYSQGPPPHPFETTTANIARRKSSGLTGQIPQTFADAIDLTKMLKIKYFWTDSLCIIQAGDGGTDWNQESGKMLAYYGNAYLTISAAAGYSANNPLFNQRTLPSSTDIRYTSDDGSKGTLTIFTLDPSKENIQPQYLTFEGNNIVTRAWTLQERILSTRNVFYAKDQMYYECNKQFQAEAGFRAHGRQYTLNNKTQELRLFGTKKRNLDELWGLMVQLYGARTMFNPNKDKFTAFSGLAGKFGDDIFDDDEYIAGLWKNKLVESLFWSTDDDPARTRPTWVKNWPPSQYRAPSWSWACIDAEIFTADGRIYRADKYPTYVNHAVFPVMSQNPYGRLTSASLILHGPEPLHLQLVKAHTDKEGFTSYDWARSADSNQKTISVKNATSIDYELSPKQLKNMNIYALVLARDTVNSTDKTHDINYLCLLVTKTSSGDYRRVGTIWLDEYALGKHAPQNTPIPNWVDLQLV